MGEKSEGRGEGEEGWGGGEGLGECGRWKGV